MKKMYYLFSLIVPAVLLLTAYHTGSPGGKTGSPGDNNNLCNDCHIGTPIHEEDWISADIPATGYLTGETYTVTLTSTDETAVLFGFEVTAEDDMGNKVGEFMILDDVETQFTNNMNAVTHTEDGINPIGNTKQWTVGWIAPEESVGNVTFYAAFNTANGNGNNTGDIIHFSEEEYMQNTTAIADIGHKNFSIYPNPAKDYVIIDQVKESEKLICSLSSLEGKQILEQEISAGGNRIDLSGISPGVYLLVMNAENSMSTQKLIIK